MYTLRVGTADLSKMNRFVHVHCERSSFSHVDAATLRFSGIGLRTLLRIVNERQVTGMSSDEAVPFRSDHMLCGGVQVRCSRFFAEFYWNTPMPYQGTTPYQVTMRKETAKLIGYLKRYVISSICTKIRIPSVHITPRKRKVIVSFTDSVWRV